VNKFNKPFSLNIKNIILITQQISNNALYLNLIGNSTALNTTKIKTIYHIGNCITPHMISKTIFNKHHLTQKINNLNPTHALPFNHKRKIPNIEPITPNNNQQITPQPTNTPQSKKS